MAIAASFLLLATTAGAVDLFPILWEAQYPSAPVALRMASDPSGNIAVLGPGGGLTSYTSTGAFRWYTVPNPIAGGDWVAAAPNGDFVVVGRLFDSRGNPLSTILLRYASDGTIQWRLDLTGFFPSVGKLLVDSGGNAYVARNALGDGQDIIVSKYNPSGALLWSQTINTGFASNNVATSLVLSADETQVAAVGDTVGGSEWITAI